MLPLVDEHAILIPAPRKRVWEGLNRYASTVLLRRRLLGLVVGTDPPAGFAISESIPEERLVLTGRHRFARYRLAFQLTDGTAGNTSLSATTCAAFPGFPGRTYRAMVVGTGAHALVVRHMLRSIARLARGEGRR